MEQGKGVPATPDEKEKAVSVKPVEKAVRGTWVQTERAAHQKWADLINRNAPAAAMLHLLVSLMDKTGVIIVSQAVLANLSGKSVSSVKRAVEALKKENWIDVVRVGSERGGVNAYCVNRRVAWADKRKNDRFAAFNARIIVAESEQPNGSISDDRPPLSQMPSLTPGEQQMPHGDGAEPPAQELLDGLEPDLPAIRV
ncbi:hypothetical protein D3C78_975840 [compost metagenome]